jgi:hypothetical protein
MFKQATVRGQQTLAGFTSQKTNIPLARHFPIRQTTPTHAVAVTPTQRTYCRIILGPLYSSHSLDSSRRNFHHGGPGSILNDLTRDSWCTKWHWYRFLPEFLHFPPLIIFPPLLRIIYHRPLWNSLDQAAHYHILGL